MSAKFALSEKGTLIVPVSLTDLGPVAASPELELDSVVLVRKREHHLTVFGYTIAKLVRKSMAVDPGLRGALDDAIASFDWSIRAGSARYRLFLESERGRLHTVIVTVDADLAGFYARAREIVAGRGDAHADLVSALGSPPTPHVTLYTSDPKGVEGIGLNNADDLAIALQRGARGEAGIQAFRLDPDPSQALKTPIPEPSPRSD